MILIDRLLLSRNYLLIGISMLENFLPGQAYRIHSLAATLSRPFRQKLIAMGLLPGTQFTVRRVAPLGDPVELRVAGCSLCVRQRDLHCLALEKIEG